MKSGGREMDIGGRGLQSRNNVLHGTRLHHQALCHQARPQTFTRPRVLRLTGKKITLRYNIAPIPVVRHRPPYVHLMSTWRHSHDRPSPFSCPSASIVNANQRRKRERPGNEASTSMHVASFPSHMYDRNQILVRWFIILGQAGTSNT